MPEPRTHYQLSFTSRQALGLFVALLLSLSTAFFFGLMAGLSRASPETGATASAAPEAQPPPAPPGEARQATPAPATIADAGPSRTRLAAPPREPAPPREEAPATLQTFEDRPAVDSAARSTPPAADARRPAPAAPDGYWVQVLSSRSEREAAKRRARCASQGFPAAVQPAPAAGGTVYRVRLGPYGSREEAARAAERIRTLEKVEPWIVPSGS